MLDFCEVLGYKMVDTGQVVVFNS